MGIKMGNENLIIGKNTLSSIYLLLVPEKNMFKIGKADNVLNRYNQLKKIYPFDLLESYEILTTKKDSNKLEKTLHYMFDFYNIKDLPFKDGYTEFFKMECFSDVLSFLESTKKIKKIEINKGIRLLETPIKNKRVYIKETEYEISLRESKRKNRQLKAFNKIVNILNKKRNTYINKEELIFDMKENKDNKRIEEKYVCKRWHRLNSHFYPCALIVGVSFDFNNKLLTFDINTFHIIKNLINTKIMWGIYNKTKSPPQLGSMVNILKEYTLSIKEEQKC